MGAQPAGSKATHVTLIVDAGPLFAVADRRDEHHRACTELLESWPGPLVVPQLVITEVAYFIRSRLGTEPEVRFLGSLAAGELATEPVRAGDWLRIAELVARYRDLSLGTVDASIVAAAERLAATNVATLDRRHFTAVRPQHVAAFTLLP